MPYLFDTSAISIAMSPRRIERHPRFGAWLRRLPRSEQFTCATVVGELRFGALHHAEMSQVLMTRIDAVLSRLTVLSYDVRAAEHYAAVRAALAAKGKEIGEADMQIAACALAHACQVVTANVKHSSRVAGLQVHIVE
jgi:tRNA(fMet)-specific endonuclease VapC